MINDEALNSLIKGVVKVISESMQNAKFNKGYTGRIFEVLDDTHYIVLINDKLFKAKSRFKSEVNDVVKLISWNNDMNELYIIY